MAAPYPNAFPPDAIENTIAGVNMGVPSTLLTRQHVADSVNVTHRGGKAKTRPRIVKRSLDFADDDSDVNSTEALFQGAAFYEGYGNQKNLLLAMIGGRLFRYSPGVSSVGVQDISITGDLTSSVAPQVWMFQGEEFMVINDGLDNPIFFDGSSTRRSAGPGGKELPPGAMGTYVNGRLVMALPNRHEFIAGDLVHSVSSGTAQYRYRDSILKIHENISVLGGRAFALPFNAGRINAMFSVAVPDSTLGQGPLQIGTRKGVHGVDLPLDANLWLNLQQPSAVVSLPSAGPLSQASVSIINTDAWYRGHDGIRSFQVGRRDMGTWVQTPLSSEIGPIISSDTDHLLEFASSVPFNNRLLMTCSPYRVAGRGVAHRGLIALDFNNISGLTMRSNPNYDGLWTGLPILQIVEGNFHGTERCFIFALDADNKICLYELLKDGVGTDDFDGTNDVPIESWVVSHALFGLESYSEKIRYPLKKIVCADVFHEDLFGTVSVDIKYRSDSYPCWVDWKAYSFCATKCAPAAACAQPGTPQKQYATFRRLPDPADDCNPITGRMHRTGYHFQVRIQWTGHSSLDRFMLWCVPTPETVPGCPTNEECKILDCCTDDYFTYQIEDTASEEDGDGDCALAISLQPEGGTFQIGSMIQMEVQATGNVGYPRVQWYFNDVLLVDGESGEATISGATTGTLIITNAQVANSGAYHAIIEDSENGCTAASDDAEVVVALAEIPLTEPDVPCESPTSTLESGYGWGMTEDQDPNAILTDAQLAHALSLFANERALQGLATPGLVVYWVWHSSHQLYPSGYAKWNSGNTDPEDEEGESEILFAGFFSLTAKICL